MFHICIYLQTTMRLNWVNLLKWIRNSFQFSFLPVAYTKSLCQSKKTKSPKPLLFLTLFLWLYVYTERRRRQATDGPGLFPSISVCDINAIQNVAQCSPDDWIWKCSAVSENCIYFFTCGLNRLRRTLDCTEFKQGYDSVLCCNPACRAGN